MEKNNKYEELEISVIEFENTDVITSSECPNETPDVPNPRRPVTAQLKSQFPCKGEHAFYNYSEVNHEQEKDSEHFARIRHSFYCFDIIQQNYIG